MLMQIASPLFPGQHKVGILDIVGHIGIKGFSSNAPTEIYLQWYLN